MVADETYQEPIGQLICALRKAGRRNVAQVDNRAERNEGIHHGGQRGVARECGEADLRSLRVTNLSEGRQ